MGVHVRCTEGPHSRARAGSQPKQLDHTTHAWLNGADWCRTQARPAPGTPRQCRQHRLCRQHRPCLPRQTFAFNARHGVCVWMSTTFNASFVAASSVVSAHPHARATVRIASADGRTKPRRGATIHSACCVVCVRAGCRACARRADETKKGNHHAHFGVPFVCVPAAVPAPACWIATAYLQRQANNRLLGAC